MAKKTAAAGLLFALALGAPAWAGPRVVKWRHLSTKTGDLQPPNAGDQQTSVAVGDFDGDGKPELAFWNQGGKALYVCDVPEKPAAADRWPCSAVYTWSDDSEMFQRQTRPYPGFKAVNEHEGFAVADVDGDGRVDLVGGGRAERPTRRT